MAEADRKIVLNKPINEIGYRPTWIGDETCRKKPDITPINARRQRRFEEVMWSLRPTEDEDPA
jgi:hypothetical protein